MTCREKLKIEHPECFTKSIVFDCDGCPHDYSYASKPLACFSMTCRECWDREVGDGLDIPNTVAAYHYNYSKEPLILEPEDWTEEEWATLCKLFGMKRAERIKVSNYTLETYGIPYTGDENR